jgi:hypothetical protein
MDKTKQILACVTVSHMLLSMIAMVIVSRKKKIGHKYYGPIAKRDRMRIEY